MPPSAITGTPVARGGRGGFDDRGELRHADAGDDARGADRAGADADLDRVGAGVDQRPRAVVGGDIAGDDRTLLVTRFSARTCSSTACEWPCAVSMTTSRRRRRSAVSARSKPLSPTVEAAPTRRRPVGVLGGERMLRRLLHVLDGDEADAAEVLVDDDQPLDLVLVQQPARLVLADPFAHRDQASWSSAGTTGSRGLSAKRTSRLVRMPTEAAGLPPGPRSTTGMPEMPCAAHQRKRVGQRRVGVDGERIDHHAALVALDLAHLLGLLGGLEIAMQDADAAGLRHGDGEPASVTVSIAEEISGRLRVISG